MYTQEREESPAELSSSPLELELDTQNAISNEYSSDELEGNRSNLIFGVIFIRQSYIGLLIL